MSNSVCIHKASGPGTEIADTWAREKEHKKDTKRDKEVLKKRRRTTGYVSCDRTQDEEFGNKDKEADDEDVERICSNQKTTAP